MFSIKSISTFKLFLLYGSVIRVIFVLNCRLRSVRFRSIINARDLRVTNVQVIMRRSQRIVTIYSTWRPSRLWHCNEFEFGNLIWPKRRESVQKHVQGIDKITVYVQIWQDHPSYVPFGNTQTNSNSCDFNRLKILN